MFMRIDECDTLFKKKKDSDQKLKLLHLSYVDFSNT